jgi:hypothetical protein
VRRTDQPCRTRSNDRVPCFSGGSRVDPNAQRRAPLLDLAGPLTLSGICFPQNDFRRVLERNPLGGHPTLTRLYRKQTPARLNRFINHVETGLNDSIAGAG